VKAAIARSDWNSSRSVLDTKERKNMVRYLALLRFTEQGIKVINKSTARASAFSEAAAKAGVKVEAQYWTTGEYDGALILSANDEASALRCIAALAAAGDVRPETLRALDAREFEAIAGK
jgi:uncharacterized protein with GYD domain